MGVLSIWNAVRPLVFAGNGPEVSVGDVMRESASHNALELGVIGVAEIGLMQIDREFNRKDGIWSWTKGKRQEYKATELMAQARAKSKELVETIATLAMTQIAERTDVTQGKEKIVSEALNATKEREAKYVDEYTTKRVPELAELAANEGYKVLIMKKKIKMVTPLVMAVAKYADGITDADIWNSASPPENMQKALGTLLAAMTDAAVEKAKSLLAKSQIMPIMKANNVPVPTPTEIEAALREGLEPHSKMELVTLTVAAGRILTTTKAATTAALE
jgi:hypothetical protein